MEENLFQCNEVRGEYKGILQTIYKLKMEKETNNREKKD